MEQTDPATLFNLALMLDLPDLLSFCRTSSRMNRILCANKHFWIAKLMKDFKIRYLDISPDGTGDPKDYYQFFKRYTNKKNIIEEAIKKDSLDLFKFLVDPDNLDNSDIIYYLSLASAVGAIDIFKHLYRREIDIHYNEDEFLRKASKYGSLNMVRYLVEEKNAFIKAFDYDALREALFRKDMDIFKYFIEKLNGKIPGHIKREFLSYKLDPEVNEYLKTL